MRSPKIDAASLAMLLPMSLQVLPDGAITLAGVTLRKMMGAGARFDEVFTIDRPRHLPEGFGSLLAAVGNGQRIFLRLRKHSRTVLRGHGVSLGHDGVLLNLGFGIGLTEAVREFALTDADFAPSELAMELLFLHEANAAVQQQLAKFTHQLEEARLAAQEQAYTDPLTGLYNRRGLEVTLSLASRNLQSLPFAIAHLDLDHFKQVNDRFGHPAGDAVLQHVARILREETRASDTSVRLGGDEFALILPLTCSDRDLVRLAQRIIARIEQPITVAGRAISISASIGITESHYYRAPEAAQMLSDADSALYIAKFSGRGRAVLHGAPEPALPPVEEMSRTGIHATGS